MDEALTGLKSALAVKIFGPDLQVLEDKAVEIKRVLQQVPGFTELTVVRELGQPSVKIDVDREKIARYGINVSDVEGVIQAAVGGQAATQVIQGEQLFDLVVRMKPEYRSSTHAIGNLLVPTPSGQQVPISELATITQGNGASFIYRENNSRYIGVQFSIEGRDLARAVDEAQKAVQSSVKLPQGYRLDWGGEYSEYVAARQQFASYRPACYSPDLYDLVRALRKFQVPAYSGHRRGDDRTGRGFAGAQAHAHDVQRLFRSGFARADGRIGGDCDH